VSRPGVRLGLRENAAQFTLLVGINALVGGMVGQERSVLSLLATEIFHLQAVSAALTYIVAFGIVKALTNFFAGTLSDRYGRKPVLIVGWLIGIPVPLMIIWAPNWSWIIVANILLGVNQGLTWSTTVIMKIDLVGAKQRGTAMGFNEFAGYVSVAATAFATGYIAQRSGLRPEPFFLGLAYVGLGLGLSVFFVRETRHHAQLEAAGHVGGDAAMPLRQVVREVSYREPALSACSQAGLVNNLNDGLAWGLFPLFFAQNGLSISEIGLLAALYPAVWGFGQLATGALSDRLGRKWLIACGMWLQAVALGLIAMSRTLAPWCLGAMLLGVGTAMVYPTLIAAIGDVAHPNWRASAVGVYRLWRDAGFAIGALMGGFIADAFGFDTAIFVVAFVTGVSGLVVAWRMYETRAATLSDRIPLPERTT
jgi:MFS family permease